MAIAHYSPTTPTKNVPLPTPALPDNYKGNIFDNKKVPLSSLLSYVQGAPWAVQYYRQILSAHSDIKELDDGLDAVYQTYELIHNLEIRVEQELSSSTDTNTQQTTVQGSGLIYPFLVPNQNDYFITQTSLGNRALFRVSKVERKTFQEQAVHSVEYQLVTYMDQSSTMYQSLVQKTVRELYFSKDRLVQGLSPLLKTQTYQEILSYENECYKLKQLYFRTFFNQRSYSLVVPGQLNLIYDPFLADFALDTCGAMDAEQLRRIKRYPTNEDVYIDQPQIWEALLKRDASYLGHCNRYMGITLVSNFDDNSFIRGAFHGVMYQIVYPREVDHTALAGPHPAVYAALTLQFAPTTNSAGTSMLEMDNIFPLLNCTVSVYPKIDLRSTYLFTPALYDNTCDKSLLEIAVWDYLCGHSPKHEHLNALLSLYPKLDRIEQFYYGPVLWLLLKTAVQGTY